LHALISLRDKLRGKKDFWWIAVAQLWSVVTVIASVKIIALYVTPDVFGHYNIVECVRVGNQLTLHPLLEVVPQI
jgi:hypothetical protein